MRLIVVTWILALMLGRPVCAADELRYEFRDEANAIHVLEVTPKQWTRPQRRLIVFATPNGNTASQSYGAKPREGRDWHYDIQHVGAQLRYAQSLLPDVDLALAIVQSGQLSWPAFRQSTDGADQQIRRLIESLQTKHRADETYLTCHSGGGSLIWGWINAHEHLPNSVTRLALLDANYSYSDELKHGDKLIEWLSNDERCRLLVMAYDDRQVEYQGKKIVSESGGTFRASQRMMTRMQQTAPASSEKLGELDATSFLRGRALFLVHPNPKNIILHTALVGEHNSLAFACLWDDQPTTTAILAGPRCYTNFIEDDPPVDIRRGQAKRLVNLPTQLLKLPPRPVEAETGSAFTKRIAALDRVAREQAIAAAILAGNVPLSSRTLVPIEITKSHAQETRTIRMYVLQDYLAVGSDDDSVRMPMTPATACEIADHFNCSLPTAQLCDSIFDAASKRLQPKPLTQARDQVTTFLEHDRLIDQQLAGRVESELIVGHKKDVIISRSLLKKDHRVAIYGWHYPSRVPIQPVYAGHVDWYTDYSHGVRLISNTVWEGEQPLDYRDILKSEQGHWLLSAEGSLDVAHIREFSKWEHPSDVRTTRD